MSDLPACLLLEIPTLFFHISTIPTDAQCSERVENVEKETQPVHLDICLTPFPLELYPPACLSASRLIVLSGHGPAL